MLCLAFIDLSFCPLMDVAYTILIAKLRFAKDLHKTFESNSM
jgi:molybdate-binding protein